MVDFLAYSELHRLPEWVALGFLVFFVFYSGKLFGLKYINALLPAQVILIFNAVPIISGIFENHLEINRIVYFFIAESGFLVVLYAAYSYILRITRGNYDKIALMLSGYVPYVMIVISIFVAIFVYFFTPQDGRSRILYQVDYWYSFVKPFIQLFAPISYFAVFLILFSSQRRIPAYGLLLVNVLGSIASGSKGAFVLQTVTALLMVRDLDFARQFHFKRIDISVAVIGLIAGVAVSLDRLQLQFTDLWDRIMLFGEPTILTYYSTDPTAACSSLSLLAKMHRGWARALGDSGAMNIDTLFGYAWTIQYVGVNTFTGPNARYSSYMICNFPGPQIFFGIVMTAFYFSLMVVAVKLASRQRTFLPVVYAFAVFSISQAGQDFNLLMQDVNFGIAFVVLLVAIRSSNIGRPVRSLAQGRTA